MVLKFILSYSIVFSAFEFYTVYYDMVRIWNIVVLISLMQISRFSNYWKYGRFKTFLCNRHFFLNGKKFSLRNFQQTIAFIANTIVNEPHQSDKELNAHTQIFTYLPCNGLKPFQPQRWMAQVSMHSTHIAHIEK